MWTRLKFFGAVFLFLAVWKGYERSLNGFKDNWMSFFEENDKMLLVIAHPDDEIMFFSPVLSQICENKSVIECYILCLSNGNYENHGNEREKVFYKVINQLFEIPLSHVKVISNNSKLRDNPDIIWNLEEIEVEVLRFVFNLKLSLRDVTVITFDERGISGHLNHISIYYGMKRIEKRSKKVFYLQTYSYVYSFFLWHLLDFNEISINCFQIFSENISMTKQSLSLYSTENTWFRQLFLTFSLYPHINTLCNT